MLARFAFAAQFWNDSGVVCRAWEDRPGPIVEQRFGTFPTWTEANACAVKLNRRAGIRPADASEIVAKSICLRDCLLHSAYESRASRGYSRAHHDNHKARLGLIHCELELALTFCETARLCLRGSFRILSDSREAVRHAKLFILCYDGDPLDLFPIIELTDSLETALSALFSPSRLTHRFTRAARVAAGRLGASRPRAISSPGTRPAA